MTSVGRASMARLIKPLGLKSSPLSSARDIFLSLPKMGERFAQWRNRDLNYASKWRIELENQENSARS
jgi:hypothetical protein